MTLNQLPMQWCSGKLTNKHKAGTAKVFDRSGKAKKDKNVGFAFDLAALPPSGWKQPQGPMENLDSLNSCFWGSYVCLFVSS